MKKMFLAATVAMALAAGSPHGIRVIDGDTFEVEATGERIRLEGWDTPELGSRYDACQHSLARDAARSAERKLNGSRTIGIIRSSTDRYGRTLADVLVDGVDIGWTLYNEGLARKYVPGKTGKGWC